MKTDCWVSLLLRLGLGLEDVLDNLGLLNEESTDDTGADTARASRTTVSTADRLLALRDGTVLARSVSLDTAQVSVAVTALGDGTALLNVKVAEVSTGGLDDLSASRLGVVRVTLAEGDTLSHLLEDNQTYDVAEERERTVSMRNFEAKIMSKRIAEAGECSSSKIDRWLHWQWQMQKQSEAQNVP